MLTDKPVSTFLDELASSAPAPGGGSAAALSGAMAAALVSMVSNLTIGRKKYVDVQQDIERILSRAEDLRRRCLELLDADIAAFSRVAEAYKMPRDTEEAQRARTAEIQAALKGATLVPMDLAITCAQIIELCPEIAEKGNERVVSDVGAGVLLAEAGLRSAALNVRINLSSIDDVAFVQEQQARLDQLLNSQSGLAADVLRNVESKL